MRTAIRLVVSLACLALIGCLVGCSGGGGGNSLAEPIIRFVNSSPDSNPLDFYYDSDLKQAGLVYLVDPGDQTVDDGDHDVVVYDPLTDQYPDAIGSTFEKDKKYVALTLGLESFGTEFEKRLRIIAFSYAKTPPNGSHARLLIMHGFCRKVGFQTPNIDFQGGNAGNYDPNNPLFLKADIPFADATPTVLEVDSGVSLIVQARRAGTENVYASSTNTFVAGAVYLALVTGVEDGVGVQAPQIDYIRLF